MDACRAAALLLVVGVLWLFVALWADEPRLRVQTPGRVATAPAEWWVRVWVRPEHDDRVLRIITDGTEYQSTDRALAGERSARVHQVWVTPLGAGCYAFRVEIRARDGDGPVLAAAQAPWPLTVIGPGVDSAACD